MVEKLHPSLFLRMDALRVLAVKQYVSNKFDYTSWKGVVFFKASDEGGAQTSKTHCTQRVVENIWGSNPGQIVARDWSKTNILKITFKWQCNFHKNPKKPWLPLDARCWPIGIVCLFLYYFSLGSISLAYFMVVMTHLD